MALVIVSAMLHRNNAINYERRSLHTQLAPVRMHTAAFASGGLQCSIQCMHDSNCKSHPHLVLIWHNLKCTPALMQPKVLFGLGLLGTINWWLLRAFLAGVLRAIPTTTRHCRRCEGIMRLMLWRKHARDAIRSGSAVARGPRGARVDRVPTGSIACVLVT